MTRFKIPDFNLELSKNIAIDWGSKYCYVWSPKTGFTSFLSQVWLDDKDRIIAWGNDSQSNLSKFRQTALIKNGYITDFKICINYIKLLLADLLDRFELVKPTVWVSISKNAHQSEIEGLEFILTRAGAGKVYFVNQNLALAINYQFDFLQDKTQTMLHVGKQLTLVSTIASSGFILERNNLFGAQNIDIAIQDYIRRVYRIVVTDSDIDNIKTLLTSKNTKTEVWGRDLVSDRIKSVELDFTEIWNQSKSQVEKLCELIKDFIHDIPAEVVNDLVDNGILLSGGGGIFGKTAEYLQMKLGVNIFLEENPRLAIIKGLQQIITHKEEYLKSGFVINLS